MSSFKITAHNGDEEQTPEHTFQSFDLCLKEGIDFLELDNRQSCDGVFFFHDEDLNRICRHPGCFRDMDELISKYKLVEPEIVECPFEECIPSMMVSCQAHDIKMMTTASVYASTVISEIESPGFSCFNTV